MPKEKPKRDLKRLTEEEAFIKACGDGDLDGVVYFIDGGVDIHVLNDEGFRDAIKYGQLDVVKYLLTYPTLKTHVDIHANNDEWLSEACSAGYIETVQYLLTSPELKEHANIHANEEEPLVFAAFEGHLDIVEYLLTSQKLAEHADVDFLNKDNCRKSKEVWEWVQNFKKNKQEYKELKDLAQAEKESKSKNKLKVL